MVDKWLKDTSMSPTANLVTDAQLLQCKYRPDISPPFLLIHTVTSDVTKYLLNYEEYLESRIYESV